MLVYVFVLKLGQEKRWRATDGTGCSLRLLNSDQPVLAGFASKVLNATRNSYPEYLNSSAFKKHKTKENLSLSS